jgi:hypothetical protein
MNKNFIYPPKHYEYGYFNRKITSEFIKGLILNNLFRVYHRPFER